MKIIIYYNPSNLDKYDNLNEEKTWYVKNLTGIEAFIKAYPDEDIEGYILPDAKSNPEFADILQAIWMHKRELYNLTIPHPTADPVKFGKMIADKYGIVFALGGAGGKVTRVQ